MVDIVSYYNQKCCISFAKDETSEDKVGFKRENCRINKMEQFPLVEFVLSMPKLQLDAETIDSHLIQAGKFRSA